MDSRPKAPIFTAGCLAFSQWARMYLAWYDGRPVAGTICYIWGAGTWELYSCSAGGEARHSNELLKWTVIRWALQTERLL